MSCSIQWFSCIIHETLDAMFVCDGGDPITPNRSPLVLIAVFENELTHLLTSHWVHFHVKWILWGFFPILCIFLTDVLLCACLVFREIVPSYSTGYTTHWGGQSTIILCILRLQAPWLLRNDFSPSILSTVRKCNSMQTRTQTHGLQVARCNNRLPTFSHLFRFLPTASINWTMSIHLNAFL